MATLAHGLPSVLLPLGADQPHNAARAQELGLARTLGAATVTADLISRSVEQVLDDQKALDRTRQVADEIRALPRVEGTVPLLEKLYATSR